VTQSSPLPDLVSDPLSIGPPWNVYVPDAALTVVDWGDMPAVIEIVPPAVLLKVTSTVPSSVNVVESPVQFAVVVSQFPSTAPVQVMVDGPDGCRGKEHGCQRRGEVPQTPTAWRYPARPFRKRADVILFRRTLHHQDGFAVRCRHSNPPHLSMLVIARHRHASFFIRSSQPRLC